MSTVGENILQIRKNLGWTQEELAAKMGYKSKSTINKIELGINDIPQSKIVKFAEVLGTTPSRLMGWSNDEIENSPSDKVDLSDGERMWLELYNKLSDESRDMLITTIEAFDKLPKDRQQFVLQMLRVALGHQE